MKGKKLILVLPALVLIFSLVGTSAVSARMEGSDQRVDLSIAGPGAIVSLPIQQELDLDVGSRLNISVECNKSVKCSKWTGRWFITYLRTSEEHWVTKCKLYVPDFIDNDQDAMNWRWSEDYIAENCSLEGEPQTWTGEYISTRKEMIPALCKQVCYF